MNRTVVVELDTSGTIDVAAERRRLEKELAGAQRSRRRPPPSWPARTFWLALTPSAKIGTASAWRNETEAHHHPIWLRCNEFDEFRPA